MPSWNDILKELNSTGSNFDAVRRKYLRRLSQYTGRNVIAYYSGWLQKDSDNQMIAQLVGIDDGDKTGFMSTICKLDRSKGLDLILHTPGGDISATESIIDYLRDCFGDNIRAIVPQLAMSGGSMIACGCKSILMGRQSSLGPVDPQMGGLSTSAIVEEFGRIREEINQDAGSIALWRPILEKYPPTLVGECEKALAWAEEILRENLSTGMLKDDPEMDDKLVTICDEMWNHERSKSHSRHFSKDKCKEIGLVIEDLEADQKLQDAVLSIHHAFTHTLSATTAVKIIENHLGSAYVQHVPINIQMS